MLLHFLPFTTSKSPPLQGRDKRKSRRTRKTDVTPVTFNVVVSLRIQALPLAGTFRSRHVWGICKCKTRLLYTVYIYIELLMPSSSITNHHHHQHQHHVENHFIILSENPPQCHDQSTTTTSTCHPAVHSEVATPEWFQAETQQHKRSRSNSMSPGSFTELVTVTSAKESEAISSSGNGNETHLVLHELHPTVFALDTKCTKMLLPPPYASLSDY